ncbi:MAG: Enoyl-[acyl-carrier-protein] reductase [NADH], partial [uncultured Microvirga sp.]
AGQARPGHGRCERPFHRLGHRQGPCRARGGARLHLPGRGARPARCPARSLARLHPRAALRRGGHRLRRRRLRRARRILGRARFRRPRDRLLGQVAAEGP